MYADWSSRRLRLRRLRRLCRERLQVAPTNRRFHACAAFMVCPATTVQTVLAPPDRCYDAIGHLGHRFVSKKKFRVSRFALVTFALCLKTRSQPQIAASQS